MQPHILRATSVLACTILVCTGVAVSGEILPQDKQKSRDERIYGPEPTPAELAELGKILENCKSGMSEADFGKAVRKSTIRFADWSKGGGPSDRSHEDHNVGKHWRFTETWDYTQEPPALVSANLYTIRALTEEEAARVKAAIKANPRASSRGELWDHLRPALQGLAWHTKAIEADDFYSTYYTVGDYGIFLWHDREPWIGVTLGRLRGAARGE